MGSFNVSSIQGDVVHSDTRKERCRPCILRQSKLLVGIGHPYLSPTPWLALCLGVPFINPVFSWDEDNPEDCTKFMAQHNSLRCYQPPLVHNIKVNDQEKLYQTIKNVVRSTEEIGKRHVPERMFRENLRTRLQEWVEVDYRVKSRYRRDSWSPEKTLVWSAFSWERSYTDISSRTGYSEQAEYPTIAH